MFYGQISLLETIDNHYNDTWWIISIILFGWGILSLLVGFYLYKVTDAQKHTKRLHEDQNLWEDFYFFFPVISLPLQGFFLPYRLYLFYLQIKMHIRGSFFTIEQQKKYFKQMEDRYEYLYWRYTYTLAWSQLIIGSCLLLTTVIWSIYSLIN